MQPDMSEPTPRGDVQPEPGPKPDPGQKPEPVLVDFGPKAFRRGVAVRLAVLVPLALVNLYETDRSDVSPVIWWSIIAVAAVIALLAVARMVRRVQLTASSIVISRVVGARKTVPRRRIASGVLVRHYQQYGNAAAPLLILLDDANKKLLYLSGQVYAGSDLLTLARTIGLKTFDVIADPTTPKEVGERHPGVLSFVERRPWAFAWIVVGVIMVVVTVALRTSGV
jgi:hypothetical protein